MKNFITLQLVFNLAITLQGFHLIAFKIDRLHMLTNSLSFSLILSKKKKIVICSSFTRICLFFFLSCTQKTNLSINNLNNFIKIPL